MLKLTYNLTNYLKCLQQKNQNPNGFFSVQGKNKCFNKRIILHINLHVVQVTISP